jgi:hypothetical protein
MIARRESFGFACFVCLFPLMRLRQSLTQSRQSLR